MRWLGFARTVTRVAGIGLICDHGGVAVGLAMHTVVDLLTGVPPARPDCTFLFALSAWHGIFVHDGNEYHKHSPSHTRGRALPRPGPNHSKRGRDGRERFPCRASMSQPTCVVIMACPTMNLHAGSLDWVCHCKFSEFWRAWPLS